MAERTIIVCDVCDDATSASTVQWRDEETGVGYELDLCERHERELGELRERLAAYMRASRPLDVPRSTRAARRRVTLAKAEQSRAVREWARRNGWPELRERGPIPAAIQAAYNERAGRREDDEL